MVNNEKEEGSTKRSIKFKEVKISTTLYWINHCQENSTKFFGLW